LERLAAFLDDEGRLLGLIAEAIELLEHHPLIGRIVENRLRELVISRGKTGYLALYDYDPVNEHVVILAIRHQREAGYQE
jgi:plasmid stabilization system protein ParE